MDLLLFSLLGLLCILQTSKHKIPRVLLSLVVVGLSGHTVLDYQMRVRMCRSGQDSIAQILRRGEKMEDLAMYRNAANNYFRAIQKTSAENPFSAEFYSYLSKETQQHQARKEVTE